MPRHGAHSTLSMARCVMCSPPLLCCAHASAVLHAAPQGHKRRCHSRCQQAAQHLRAVGVGVHECECEHEEPCVPHTHTCSSRTPSSWAHPAAVTCSTCAADGCHTNSVPRCTSKSESVPTVPTVLPAVWSAARSSSASRGASMTAMTCGRSCMGRRACACVRELRVCVCVTTARAARHAPLP